MLDTYHINKLLCHVIFHVGFNAFNSLLWREWYYKENNDDENEAYKGKYLHFYSCKGEKGVGRT